MQYLLSNQPPVNEGFVSNCVTWEESVSISGVVNQTLFACLVGSRHGRGETVVRMWRRRQAGLQQRMWCGGCTSLVGTRASGDGWCPLISESQSPCVHVSRVLRSASGPIFPPQAPSHQNLPAFVDIFIQFSSVIVPAVTSNTLPHQTEAPLRVFTCYFDGAGPSQATICFILTGE